MSGIELYAVDPFDWNDHASRVKYIEGLTDYEKVKAEDALVFLGKRLGDGFLRHPDDQNNQVSGHPLSWLLINVVPWTRRYLIRLADNVRTVDGAENLKKLLADLKDADLFEHNSLVLDCAAKLSREGFEACFEPTRTVGNNEKQPDVRVTNSTTGEVVFLEIATTCVSSQERRSREDSSALSLRLMRADAGLRWCGRLRKSLAPQHWDEVLKKVESALRSAGLENRFATVVEEGVIELAICPEEQSAVLEAWAAEHGMQPGTVMGPPIPANHVERLRKKIANEQEQLPLNAANALLIQNTDIFFFTKDIRALISALEEDVYRYPHLAMVIIQGINIGGEAPEVIQKGEHRYSRRAVDDMCEQSLLLVNRFCSTKLSIHTLSSFLRVF